jgi:glutathione S-transferase
MLSIDGRRIGDSTAIVAALEELYLAPPLYPLAGPEEGPIEPDAPSARGFEEFREPLVERRGLQWVKQMFHRHRKPAAAPAGAAAAS